MANGTIRSYHQQTNFRYSIVLRSLILPNLQSINSTVGNGNERVQFFIGANQSQSLPKLTDASRSEYRIASGATLNLGDQAPAGALLDMSNQGAFVLETGETVNAPNLTSAEYTWFTGGSYTDGNDTSAPLPAGSVINAPRLSSVRRSTINLNNLSTFNTAALAEIDDARIYVSGGVTYNKVTDTNYLSTNHWGSTDLFRASEAGTVLNLSSLQTLTFGQNTAPRVYTVRAQGGGTVNLSGLTNVSVIAGQDDILDFRADGGTIDLSKLQSINSTAGNGNERVRFYVGEQGKLKLGNLAVANRVEINLQHISSDVEVKGSLFLESTSSIGMVEGAKISIVGDLLFRQTDETKAQFQNGLVRLNGSGMQYLEAGGQDVGIAGNATTNQGNFGIGRLEIGQVGVATTVHALDLFNNGNRGANLYEALYLDGLGGLDGLLIHPGSMLVLNDVNIYARISGVMTHLNSIVPSGASAVQFGAGFLALQQPLAGDYNFDNRVDQEDYLAWKSSFGSAENLAADGNHNGVVDAADYSVWRDHIGSSPAATGAQAAIPEPGTAPLLIGVLVSLVTRFRSRLFLQNTAS